LVGFIRNIPATELPMVRRSSETERLELEQQREALEPELRLLTATLRSDEAIGNSSIGNLAPLPVAAFSMIKETNGAAGRCSGARWCHSEGLGRFGAPGAVGVSHFGQADNSGGEFPAFVLADVLAERPAEEILFEWFRSGRLAATVC